MPPPDGNDLSPAPDEVQSEDGNVRRGRGPLPECGNMVCRILGRSNHVLRIQVRRLKEKLGESENDRRRLREQVKVLTDKLSTRNKRKTERTWPGHMRDLLAGAQDAKSYDTIWKLSQREENMSSSPNVLHPAIKLVPPTVGLLDEDEDDADAEDGEGSQGMPALPRNPTNSFPSSVSIRGLIEWHNPSGVSEPQKPFPFERLPTAVQAKIFRLWLHKEGQLVHCLSRLDPFQEPERVPSEEACEYESGLLNRFYFQMPDGHRASVSLTHGTEDPNEVLKVLLVSRRWYFIGVHVFYGLNTFAFSSLGEFGRFCVGTGSSRVARIQNLELTWVGNQYLTLPCAEGKRTLSKRTQPLMWLCKMPCLKTLAVHINEKDAKYIDNQEDRHRRANRKGRYMRRPYEPASVVKCMEEATRGQPNNRLFRSLRTVQGLDYVYQLRGMHWIKWYELSTALADPELLRRQMVFDLSFVRDISRATGSPKVPSRRHRDDPEQLRSLFPVVEEGHHFHPSPEDWEMIKTFYEVNIGDREPSEGAGSRDLNASASNTEGSGSDDNSDDSDDERGDGAVRARARRNGLMAPPGGSDNEHEPQDGENTDRGGGSLSPMRSDYGDGVINTGANKRGRRDDDDDDDMFVRQDDEDNGLYMMSSAVAGNSGDNRSDSANGANDGDAPDVIEISDGSGSEADMNNDHSDDDSRGDSEDSDDDSRPTRSTSLPQPSHAGAANHNAADSSRRRSTQPRIETVQYRYVAAPEGQRQSIGAESALGPIVTPGRRTRESAPPPQPESQQQTAPLSRLGSLMAGMEEAARSQSPTPRASSGPFVTPPPADGGSMMPPVRPSREQTAASSVILPDSPRAAVDRAAEAHPPSRRASSGLFVTPNPGDVLTRRSASLYPNNVIDLTVEEEGGRRRRANGAPEPEPTPDADRSAREKRARSPSPPATRGEKRESEDRDGITPAASYANESKRRRLGGRRDRAAGTGVAAGGPPAQDHNSLNPFQEIPDDHMAAASASPVGMRDILDSVRGEDGPGERG